MINAQTEVRPLRPALSTMIEDMGGGCTGCGVCASECAFLTLYGSPRQIAGSYNPEDPKKNVICFECSLCGLCSAVCPEKLDPQALFLEMRREAVDRGFGVFPEHRGLLGYERTGTSRRFSWYGLPDGCSTVFFPGCALPGTRPVATMAVYERLQKTIPALGLVMDCCTKPSHDLGRQDYFRQMFDEMANWLEKHGVQRILVACPNCYKVFSEYGTQFVTETVYEKLAEFPTEADIQLESTVVTIHDPCVVRTADAPQDAVRRLLTSTGSQIEEMAHSRRTALCCGEGGTVAALAPDLADSWGERRIREADGRRVITYCAGCANHLGKRLDVRHILDVVCKTPQPSSGPITYLNRLRLKSRFKNLVPAAITRERTAAGATASRVLKPLCILAALVGTIFLVRTSGIGQYLDPEKLRALFASFGLVAPLVYIAFYAVAPALMLPGLPISMAGATVFGPVWGVVYTIIGATLGACLAFLIARYAARDWVERRLVGSRWNTLDSETARNGWKAVAFTRLIPLFPFNLLNFAFGLTKIPFTHYALATFIFMLPGTIAFITFSSSLLGLLKGKVSKEFFIGITLIVAVSMAPKAVKWYQSRPEKPSVPWSLGRSLRIKAIILAALGALSATVYLLIQKFFWAVDAYIYTIEFNLLFIMSRFRDAELAAFVEYLRPMSPLRASGIALVSRAVQNGVQIFSPLNLEQVFLAAFGTLHGALLATVSGVAICFLAAFSGRLLFGDLLPLFNLRSGKEPLTPAAAWCRWSALALLSIPAVPLLVGGLWVGAVRIPLGRSFALITAGMVVRILITFAAP